MSDTTSSPFMAALMDPGVQALLGASQGFAQAAMPSRMPIPFGAAIGMGAGGALAGAANAQKMQLTGQQITAADIANQRARMLMNYFAPTGAGGNLPGGSGIPGGGVGGGGGAVVPGSVPTANNNYLVSPSSLVGLGNLAMMTGQDRTAAQLYGMTSTMAGGPGFAMGQGGGAFRVPGGIADPGVIYSSAAAKAGGAKAAELPYTPPTNYQVPTLNPDGTPALDAAGRPTFHQQLMTAPQANGVVSGVGQPAAMNAPDPFPGWAARINGHENGGGPPDNPNHSGPGGAPTSTAMGNGQFLEGTWPSVLRAVRPDLTAGKTDAQLLPLRGVPGLAAAATEQYARMNAAALAQGGLPVNGGTVALAHEFGIGGATTLLRANPNAPLSMLPGMGPVLQANPSLQGMTAGQLVQQYQTRMGGAAAPAQAPVQTSAQMPGIAGPPALTPSQVPVDLRPGGMRIDPLAGTVIKNPELHSVTGPGGIQVLGHVNPASPYAPVGTPGDFVPVISVPPPAAGPVAPPPGVMPPPVGGSAVTPSAPVAPPAGGLPPGQPVGNLVSPDTQAARTHLVEEFHGKDTDSYVAAQNTGAWLNQIDRAAEVMNHAGALYQTGPFAGTRLGIMGGINDAVRTLGLTSPFDQSAIASAEELRKATTTAGFELSSHYEGHARQAAATIMNATSAVPGVANSPQGVRLVSAGIREGAQSAMDSYQYRQQRYTGQDPFGINPAALGKTAGAGLETAEPDFYRAFPATMYANRAISTQHPFSISATDQAAAMKQMEQYLPGTLVKLANGKVTMVPPRPNAPPIPSYMQSYLQPQGGQNAP